MQDIRLIALDLDGTLLAHDHETLSPQNRTVLEAAAARGVEIVVATGRSICAIAPQVMELPFLRYFITGNGSTITLRDGTPIYQRLIPAEIALPLVEHLAAEDGYLTQLYANGRMFISQKDWDLGHSTQLMPHHLRALALGPHGIVPDLLDCLKEQGGEAEKINIPYIAPERKESLCRWVQQQFPGEIRAVSSLPWNLELNHVDACKGGALLALCEQLEISSEACIAFGDADNDIEMLQAAGVGVAMGNAGPAVKAAADMVTLTNDESGVAAALGRLLGLEY